MLKYPNGFIIQDKSCPTNILKVFNYQGINAYDTFPLMSVNTPECREISNRISVSEVCEGIFEMREFISNENDLDEYIRLCRELSFPLRTLFIESDYCDEIWKGSLPQMRFIGYEYCPLPIDCQIITDLDWCPHVRKHLAKMNEYGLFQTEEDAISFKNDYIEAQSNGYVGDSGVQAYIFKVSIVEEVFDSELHQRMQNT